VKKDENALRDVRKVGKSRQAISTPVSSTGSIVVNYFSGEALNAVDKGIPTVSHITEVSEVISRYPFIFQCKGNTDIIIQSVWTPNEVIRLPLKSESGDKKGKSKSKFSDMTFMSFVEMNENFVV
jgi:hypothetical protein